MEILVCIKQVMDPEVPARDFRIDAATRAARLGSANLVTNIFCENALETALQLRESSAPDTKISALSFGALTAEDSLRKALAMKANSATLVVNDGNPNPDPLTVARVLAAAARKMNNFDLILLGRESGDWGAGQVGALLAEELDYAYIAFADHLECSGGRLFVSRQTDFGRELLEALPPIVITVTNASSNVPRLPKVRDVMMSGRQPLTKWTLEDLGIDASDVRTGNSYYEVTDLFIPQKETHCQFVTGDSLEEKVEAFAKRLAVATGAL